jgi:hypothetical protein
MSGVKQAWGFQSDADETLKGKSGGKFGLNHGFVTKFEYNGLAGKDESPADAIDISVQAGDKEYRSRIYDITGDLFKGKNKVSPGAPGYDDLYNDEKKQLEAVIVHTLKAMGITEDQIKIALQTGNVIDFKSWAIAMTNAKGAGFETRPIDFFLEYQWEIKGENTMTFLQLPKNMKGARFLSPAIKPVGSWTEERSDENGLRYVDDAANEHPFTKSANFMSSHKAIQQFEGEEPTGHMAATPGAGATAGQPAAKKW